MMTSLPVEQAQRLLDRLPDSAFSSPPGVGGVDVALVRDGRIAALYTLLTAQSRRSPL